jgi:hypothetical protein
MKLVASLVIFFAACQPESATTPDAGVVAHAPQALVPQALVAPIPNTRCGGCTAHIDLDGLSWTITCCVETTSCRPDLGCREIWVCHATSCRPGDIDPNP